MPFRIALAPISCMFALSLQIILRDSISFASPSLESELESSIHNHCSAKVAFAKGVVGRNVGKSDTSKVPCPARV
ncbi:hypothetical protein BU26DRAFT_517240, partial [Trematosphaeria pertusa]